MTNYSRGAALERKIKKALEADGYLVMRSAGSKGPLDLIAVSINDMKFIQVKNHKPTAAARRKAKETSDKYRIVVTLMWPEGQEEIIA